MLAKRGAILPLSLDNLNSVGNPVNLEVAVFEGTGNYSLYEDGLEEGRYPVMMTDFTSEFVETNGVCTQSLQISTRGDGSVIPQNRVMKISFRNVRDGRVKLFVDGEETPCKIRLSEFVEAYFPFDASKTYRVEVLYPGKTPMEKLIARAKRILTEIQAGNYAKELVWKAVKETTTPEEYAAAVDNSSLDLGAKLRLKETL